FSIEVKGVFDDCQALVKKSFVDPDFRNLNLSSANSISVGRLIPQIIYYVYTYSMMIKENIEFVVPCGNFGNVCAGIFAKKMGLPFEKFLVVNNMNDPVLKYYQTGIFEPKTTVVQTLSTAMDIGNPSNFIRILEVFGHDHAAFKKVVKVLKVTDQKTVETIKKVYKKYQYELDPHTAVAWNGAEKDNDPGYLKVILSTASPLKFADVINQRAGIVIDDSEVIKELEKKAKRKITINNDYDEFKKTIISLPL
ncbi:MAG: pyridoxal-phosphate dependent enzyme, partial [Patescibacteria group bacterium]